ncbi:MAG: carboxypeptidase-like regulatory domain-containing protein, partial [Bacteroidota bacterium]|nr:carboxypeptidase-like regulatory domain-containing protein [Bacteroidota bacterium]
MNRALLKPLAISLLCLFHTLAVFSQDKFFYVRGTVTDAKTGLPLAGASVFCQNTTTGTVSGNEGHFTLRLANGGYDMVVSY